MPAANLFVGEINEFQKRGGNDQNGQYISLYLVFSGEYLNRPVCPAERGIDLGTDADETAGHGVHQVVLLGKQGNYPTEDGLTGQLALAVLAHQT